MAKNKKPAKATKKPVAKAKSKNKKVVSAKKAAKKKDIVKKATSTKGVSKKVVAKKKAAPKVPLKKATTKITKSIADSKQESITKTITPKSVEKTITPKMPVAQMNMFQMPTQRPIAHKPQTTPSTKDERTRYSEDELKEFETLINGKLAKARDEYRILKETLNRNNDEGTDATSGGNTKVLEDGAETAEKENLSQLAARQQKYITNLENALVRIKNGTYGICSVTGKLISKERLIAVPHTTQSIEAKMMQQD